MKRKKTISVGIPCFNEELNVIPAHNELLRVTKNLRNYNFEFIFVDNGSVDRTREKIAQLVSNDHRVKGIFLSRNFGPENSGQAAIDFASGDAFVYYESDGQDPADMIPKFIKKWEEGYDIVVGIRTKIVDNPLMTLARKTFYRVFKRISNIDVPVNAGSFGLMSRRAVSALSRMPEKYRFFRGLRAWVGFKTAYLSYARRARARGRSSYNLLDYLHHAERSFFGFSYVPLDIIVYMGIFLVVTSFIVLIIYLLYRIFYNPYHIADLPVILSAIIFFGGIQMIAISFVGKYVQVILEETKGRPLYIVEEIIGKKGRRP